ncbi:MAG: hypothetical protein ACXVCY_06220 [Pseudobdellovibrionaceae bacterium]
MLTKKRYSILAFLVFLTYDHSSAKQKSNPEWNTSVKPACDASTVTKNCDFFRKKEDQAIIKLPDGSTIINPLFKIKVPAAATEQKSPIGISQFDYDKMIFNQSELIDALDDSDFSTRFKMSFINVAVGLKLNPKALFELPWPPDDKDAPKKAVTKDEVETYLKENLDENEYNHLDEVITSQATPLQAQFEAQQQAQQKAMELTQKAQEENNLYLNQSNKKKNRIKELFKYSQETLIEIIRRGKKDSQLTAEEKILIEKINTIELTDLNDPTNTNPSRCPKEIKNAYYSPLNHTINICPNIIMSSDASLVSAISHELAHSIDSCTAQMPLLQIDSEKLKAFLANPSLTPEDKKNVSDTLSGNTKYSNIDLSLLINNPAIQRQLVSSGVVKEIQPGISIKKHPFAKEYNCFKDKMKFDDTSAEEVAFSKKYIKEQIYSNKNESSISKVSTDRYLAAIDKYPQCLSGITPKTEMRETMSDMFGALTEEKFLLENPFKNNDEAVFSILFIENTCENAGPSTQNNVSPEDIDIMLREKINHFHPKFETRISKIFLNLPGTARLFDCRRTAPACFDHLSFSRRMTSAKPSTGSKSMDSDSRLEKGIQ